MARKQYSDSLQLPLFELKSDWKPPVYFPESYMSEVVAIDTETKDPYLKTHGCGGSRGLANIAGISIATDSGFVGYFPFAHLGGGNFEREKVIYFFKSLLSQTNLTVVFCNAIYDLEMLKAEGIEVKSKLHCIRVAEGLIDEESPFGFSLNGMCKKYKIPEKEETLLIEAAKRYSIDPKSEMWKLPSKFVGPYAEGDAEKTLKIFYKQQAIIQSEGLTEAYNLERRLLPIILKMKFQGIPFNEEKAAASIAKLQVEENKIIELIYKKYGRRINPWTGSEVATICKDHNIYYPKTEKGNPSFKQEFLELTEEPFFKLIKAYRVYNRCRSTFIEKVLDSFVHNGRVYPNFFSTRQHNDDSDSDEGTRQRRFTSSKPNFLAVPSSDERKSKLSYLVRACYEPEKGCSWWKGDFSQQEARIALHFAYKAKCKGAKEARQLYLEDKTTDFYKYMMSFSGLDRKTSKALFLSKMYRQGNKGYANKTGCSIEEAVKVQDRLNKTCPWIGQISDIAMKAANDRGYVKTILNSRRHFNKWISKSHWDHYRETGEFMKPLYYEEAVKKWGEDSIIRADTRKALNGAVQGTGGDMIKQAMVNVDDAFNGDIVPYLTVYDELDLPIPKDDTETSFKMKSIMEDTLSEKLTVPSLVEEKILTCWK